MRLEVAEVDRPRQHIDLRAAIVDVVFPRDVIARVIQKRGQRIAKDRAPGVTHVQRPRRVGRNIFDVDLQPLPHVGPAIGLTVGQNGLHDPGPDSGIKTQVQKAGACDLGAGDARVFGQAGGQSVGDIARLHLGGFRQDHGGIGGHVAMPGIARRFDRNVGKVQPLGQVSGLLHGSQRVENGCANVGE